MDGEDDAEAIEEVGESSSPAKSSGGSGGLGGCDVKREIYERLLQDGNEEALGNPRFKEELDAHFNRLPHSYQLDVSADRADIVLVHQKMLTEARDPDRRPVFRVHFLRLEEQTSEVTTDLEDEDGADIEDALLTRHEAPIPIHEIVFSSVDKPKLLSQLSALLSDIELNIREAHVFSTNDGYSLDVFVVDGWHEEDPDSLCEAIKGAITKDEGSWSGSSHSSATERLLAMQPKVGEWEIDMKLLKMGDKIAFGSYGDLYHGSYMGQDVAVKVMRSDHLNNTMMLEFTQEVLILKEVNHKNVVRFIGACTKAPQLCIVTEYMPGGNLYEFLHKQENNLQLFVLLKFAIDVCNGMNYLHQNNIIHRDLKTANLLMDNDNVVKVADFGVARFQNQGGEMTAETGTYRWMAPEVINHQPYDQKADVFSFGIVLWELSTSKIPYGDMTPLQAALGVRQGLRPIPPHDVHPKLSNLMHQCWQVVPAKRPTFAEITLELEDLLELVQGAGEASHLGKGSASEQAES